MKAEVRLHNGTPTLLLDDEPAFASYLWATTTDYAVADVARAYADDGIHLYAFDVGTVGETPEWSGPGPDHSGPYDFSTVEARYGRILNADPDARFHLRVHLELRRGRNDWWLDRYPDERDLDSEGERTTQSFASEVWRTQGNDFLRAYVAHLQGTGLDERAIAYQVGAGHTGKWVKGHTSMWHTCGDYSRPMQRCFRDWLRRTYHDDVVELRETWSDPEASIETAQVPSALAQLTTTHMAFRDPRQEGPVIDAYRCLADRCADLIADFCNTIKMATESQALVGAFYGYLMELAWNAGDVLFASRQLFGAHTVAGGPRTFRLPHPVEVVYDLFEQETVAAHTSKINVTLQPRSTVLYYTGDAERLNHGLGRSDAGK